MAADKAERRLDLGPGSIARLFSVMWHSHHEWYVVFNSAVCLCVLRDRGCRCMGRSFTTRTTYDPSEQGMPPRRMGRKAQTSRAHDFGIVETV
jgi:hypothetical protein